VAGDHQHQRPLLHLICLQLPPQGLPLPTHLSPLVSDTRGEQTGSSRQGCGTSVSATLQFTAQPGPAWIDIPPTYTPPFLSNHLPHTPAGHFLMASVPTCSCTTASPRAQHSGVHHVLASSAWHLPRTVLFQLACWHAQGAQGINATCAGQLETVETHACAPAAPHLADLLPST
jgi:hypothetical protein